MSTNTGKQKAKIAVIIGVFSLILLVFVLLLCEGAGTFVGKVLNRPAVSSYLKKTYDGLECKYIDSEIVNEERVRLGIPQQWRAYRFEYEVENYSGDLEGFEAGDRFFIEAYSFEVINDGLYSEYLADRELIDYSGELLAETMNASQTFSEYGLTVESAYYDLCIYSGAFEGEKEARFSSLDESGKLADTDCVIHVLGKSVAFEEYKKIASELAVWFKNNETYKPGFLQVVYYYEKDHEKTMQYESRFEFYELDLAAENLVNAPNIHYIVELDEEQKAQAKAYNIVKYVYLTVVSATVIALSTLWVVRKIKKIKKEVVADGEPKENEREQ